MYFTWTRITGGTEMKLPILYKKTNTNVVQFWSIAVYQEHMNGESPPGASGMIQTTYGQLETDSPQITRDFITEGKNIGKKNETTAIQQAEFEARSKWEKQKKKGYVESVEEAKAGKTDKIIEGGINPMLAHKFTEQGHKITFPCFFQPKLDGIRCIAIIENGKCTLWSRTRKSIKSLPHIVEELEEVFKGQSIVLDGEAYNHSFRSDFEKIVSVVRKDEADMSDPNTYLVEYHVYDIIDITMSFQERFFKLSELFNGPLMGSSHIAFVRTRQLESEEMMEKAFRAYRDQGYEGIMLRNSEGKYVNKRSYDLQKVKEFNEEDFDIVGIEEGNGKLAGHVGSFICKGEGGRTFNAKMEGSVENLRRYFEDHSTWQGKKLSVQFQGLTGTNKVPRFPVGKAIRDYE